MNLKAILTAISLIPEILPVINTTVQDIEAAFSGLPGAQKLAAAEAKINTYLGDAIQDVAVLADLKPLITTFVNAAVAAFNAVGLFKKATPPAPAAQSAD